jgi:hypothetical protein
MLGLTRINWTIHIIQKITDLICSTSSSRTGLIGLEYRFGLVYIIWAGLLQETFGLFYSIRKNIPGEGMVLFENYPKNTRITLLYHILNYS